MPIELCITRGQSEGAGGRCGGWCWRTFYAILTFVGGRWRRIRTSWERSVGICCAKGSRAGLVWVCVAADDAYGIVCGETGDVQPEHGEDVRSGREADDSPALTECR